MHVTIAQKFTRISYFPKFLRNETCALQSVPGIPPHPFSKLGLELLRVKLARDMTMRQHALAAELE